MKWKDMVGHYIAGHDGVYLIIEYDRSHGFYIQAVSSGCERAWRDLSERAIDRTYYGDWHPNFWHWERSRAWLEEHPEVVCSIEGHALYFPQLAAAL